MFRWSVFYELGMACDNIEERAELWQAIMEYGLYGKEPPQKFKRDFINIRFILEKSKKISYLRGQAWKKHTWNQYTKGDTKWKAQKNHLEQMEQNGTNGTKQFYSYSNSISTNNISNSISNNSIVRNKYLEYVYLSDIEYKKLIETYWEKVIENEIENLNNYIWQKWGKDPYKSHYYTILNWLRKSWAKKLPTTTTQLNDFQIEDWVYDIDKINSFNS